MGLGLSPVYPTLMCLKLLNSFESLLAFFTSVSSILVVDIHVSPEAGSMCIYFEAAETDLFEIHDLLVQCEVKVKLR